MLSFVIFAASFILSTKAGDKQKLTAYECGFNPFSDTKNEFDVRFYIVAVLFLIFDLEIMFLFPFVSSVNSINTNSFLSMLFFLTILTVGFFYE